MRVQWDTEERGHQTVRQWWLGLVGETLFSALFDTGKRSSESPTVTRWDLPPQLTGPSVFIWMLMEEFKRYFRCFSQSSVSRRSSGCGLGLLHELFLQGELDACLHPAPLRASNPIFQWSWGGGGRS